MSPEKTQGRYAVPHPRGRDAIVVALLAGLALVGCADTTPGKYRLATAPEQEAALVTYRAWLGLFFATQYVLLLWGAKRLNEGRRLAGLLLMLIVLPLAWSKLGEWGYRLAAWIFSWGVLGKILIVIGGLLSGLGGAGNVFLFVLCAFIFHDVELLRWAVLPSAAVAVIVNLVTFSDKSTGGGTGSGRIV